jgi:hypothetical protein
LIFLSNLKAGLSGATSDGVSHGLENMDLIYSTGNAWDIKTISFVAFADVP